MKVYSQDAYDRDLQWHFELEKRLGLAKDDDELIRELKDQKQND